MTDREYGVMDFACAPDGRTVIIARAIGRELVSPPDGGPGYYDRMDFEVRGFDANTGATRFHHVLGRGRRVYCPWIISGGALVMFHSPEGASTVWEVATGKRLDTIGRLADAYVSKTRDRRLIVKRPRGQLEVVDEATGEARIVLKGGETWSCVASSVDGNIAALRRGDEVAIWDLSTNQVVRQRRGKRHQSDDRTAAFSPDGTVLAVGYGDGDIELWDVGTLELRRTLPGHSQSVHDCTFTHDGRTLISVSSDGMARLWDVATGEELFVLNAPNGAVFTRIRLSPDGRTAGFGAFDGEQSWLYLLPTALPAEVESEENP